MEVTRTATIVLLLHLTGIQRTTSGDAGDQFLQTLTIEMAPDEMDIPLGNIDEFDKNDVLKSESDFVNTFPDDNTYIHNKRNAFAREIRSWRSPIFTRRFRYPLFRKRPVSPVSRRRSKQLSVAGPLSALANMLAAEGRRRQQTESRSNRMRLLELGKRSAERSPSQMADRVSDNIHAY